MKIKKSAVAVGMATILAGGVLAGCGGGEPTAQDMKQWQQDARSTLASSEAGKAITENDSDSDAFLTDCSGTLDKARQAFDSIPNPPYKGDQWRSSVNEILDAMGDKICPAVEDGDLGKLMVYSETLKNIDQDQKQWVKDANAAFPTLNWTQDTYLG
jgi:hypothetical protein